MNHRFNASHHRSEDKTQVERLLGWFVKCQWWLLLVLGVAGGVFYYRQPLPAPTALQASIKKLTAEKQSLQIQHDQMVNRVDWAKNDDDYLEIIARDRLNKQKEGEVIVRFKE
ncbi:MAG: septum formation initiator family protein [Verrucomicrobiaceae bacterium]|nr:septum formation initiator family protein [Verrucomicrobiaceae bacterium]